MVDHLKPYVESNESSCNTNKHVFDIYKTPGKILLQSARGLKRNVRRGSSHRGLSADSLLFQYNSIGDDNPT